MIWSIYYAKHIGFLSLDLIIIKQKHYYISHQIDCSTRWMLPNKMPCHCMSHDHVDKSLLLFRQPDWSPFPAFLCKPWNIPNFEKLDKHVIHSGKAKWLSKLINCLFIRIYYEVKEGPPEFLRNNQYDSEEQSERNRSTLHPTNTYYNKGNEINHKNATNEQSMWTR